MRTSCCCSSIRRRRQAHVLHLPTHPQLERLGAQLQVPLAQWIEGREKVRRRLVVPLHPMHGIQVVGLQVAGQSQRIGLQLVQLRCRDITVQVGRGKPAISPQHLQRHLGGLCPTGRQQQLGILCQILGRSVGQRSTAHAGAADDAEGATNKKTFYVAACSALWCSSSSE